MVDPNFLFGRLGNRMFQGAYLYSQFKKGLIPDIYVQDNSYFDEYRNEIKNLYALGIPEKTDMIAIHVRRGDYVNNDFYIDLMETPYYRDAMILFLTEKFVVFSDDIEWCRKQPIFNTCEFYHSSEIEDMNEMASCKGIIIANSSFSWWAAYISPYAEKVIAPKMWYNDNIERTKCPENWIKI